MLLTILLGNPHILTRLFTLSFNGCVRLIARRVQLKIHYAYLYKNANSSPGPSRLHFWRQIGTATQAQITRPLTPPNILRKFLPLAQI